MLTFPEFNPYIFKLGPVHPTWYGLMYVIGFGCAYLLGVQRTKSNPAWSKEDVSDLMTYLMLGVVLGGRIGYVLFYGMGYWAQDLLYPFKIWEGGMSFHGGLLGVMFALWLFGRKKGKRFWDVNDYVAPMIPPGLFFGRIGNFINGELWGRPTDVPWGMVFPGTHDGIPRLPLAGGAGAPAGRSGQFPHRRNHHGAGAQPADDSPRSLADAATGAACRRILSCCATSSRTARRKATAPAPAPAPSSATRCALTSPVVFRC